jgi:hypothetical protein
MPTIYNIIFQYEATNALVDAYTVPVGTSHVVSTVNICNFSVGTETIILKIAKGGAADTNAHYIYPDISCDPNDTFQATAGFTLEAGDIVRIQASANNAIAITFFGSTTT